MKQSTHDISRPSNENANSAETDPDNLETMALFSSCIDSRTRCSRENSAEGSQTQECDRESRPEAHKNRQYPAPATPAGEGFRQEEGDVAVPALGSGVRHWPGH